MLWHCHRSLCEILTFSNPDIALVLKKVRVSKVNSQNVEQAIDGETGWRMVVPTTLKCFLCGGQVIYKNKDTTRSRTTSPSPSSTWPLVVPNGHYGIWQYFNFQNLSQFSLSRPLPARFYNHLANEHGVVFEMDFILAACRSLSLNLCLYLCLVLYLLRNLHFGRS